MNSSLFCFILHKLDIFTGSQRIAFNTTTESKATNRLEDNENEAEKECDTGLLDVLEVGSDQATETTTDGTTYYKDGINISLTIFYIVSCLLNPQCVLNGAYYKSEYLVTEQADEE
jgi:hypothetical protein